MNDEELTAFAKESLNKAKVVPDSEGIEILREAWKRIEPELKRNHGGHIACYSVGALLDLYEERYR